MYMLIKLAMEHYGKGAIVHWNVGGILICMPFRPSSTLAVGISTLSVTDGQCDAPGPQSIAALLLVLNYTAW